jgi:hypothetical protein
LWQLEKFGHHKVWQLKKFGRHTFMATETVFGRQTLWQLKLFLVAMPYGNRNCFWSPQNTVTKVFQSPKGL